MSCGLLTGSWSVPWRFATGKGVVVVLGICFANDMIGFGASMRIVSTKQSASPWVPYAPMGILPLRTRWKEREWKELARVVPYLGVFFISHWKVV